MMQRLDMAAGGLSCMLCCAVLCCALITTHTQPLGPWPQISYRDVLALMRVVLCEDGETYHGPGRNKEGW